MSRASLRPGRWLALITAFWFILPEAAPGLPQSPPAGAPEKQGAAPAPSPAPQTPNQGIISYGSAVQSGPAPDLVLFYEGEVLGWTEPCG